MKPSDKTRDVLLIGASGLLGTNLNLTGQVFKPSHQELDISSFISVDSYIKHHIEVGHLFHTIVLAAAYTNVAAANYEKNLVYNTNIKGPLNLITSIQSLYKIYGIKNEYLPRIVYISSDYVFSGDRGPYATYDPIDPVKNNYYALSKALGETAMRAYENHCIVRTSFCRNDIWLYEKAFHDQYTSRDTIDKIAPMISFLINDDVFRSIWHIGTERKSVWDLAKRINPDVQPMSRLEITSTNIPYDTSLVLNNINIK